MIVPSHRRVSHRNRGLQRYMLRKLSYLFAVYPDSNIAICVHTRVSERLQRPHYLYKRSNRNEKHLLQQRKPYTCIPSNPLISNQTIAVGICCILVTVDDHFAYLAVDKSLAPMCIYRLLAKWIRMLRQCFCLFEGSWNCDHFFELLTSLQQKAHAKPF